MSAPSRIPAFVFCLTTGAAWSGDPPPTSQTACTREGLIEHVVGQFRTYGPQSTRNEYFGFVYRDAGVLKSAVVKSGACRADKCTLDSTGAARQIPAGAKVLGEWHTHPRQTGSRGLSVEDVRGALNNSGIRCYSAFYGAPDGRIYEWKPASTSVPAAMASRALIGNYAEDPKDAAIFAARKPGEPELRQDGTQEADVGAGISPEGVGLGRDDFKSDKENERNLAGADKEEPKADAKTDAAKTEAARSASSKPADTSGKRER
jgi:hypothetical protein